MRLSTRLALVTLLGFALTGCGIVYRLPTRQGNVIEQSELNKLQIGMTKKQVSYILGTPIASSPFESSRWDYLGYYKSPRGNVSSRTVSLFFDNAGTLDRMIGVKEAGQTVAPTAPDKAALAKEQKQVDSEQSRASSAAQQSNSGVINSNTNAP